MENNQMSIHQVIASLKDQDKKKYFELRSAMRKAYLVSMHKTIGIKNYSVDDDVQLDRIDYTVAGLMTRAAMGDTPGNAEQAEENKKEVVGEDQLKQLESAITGVSGQPKPWGTK